MSSESPSRYEALAKLAIEHSKDFFARKKQASRFGYELVKRFIAYLGCPPEKATHISIAAGSLDFCSDEDRRQFLSCLPKLTYHDDGFWYFGIAIEFSLRCQSLYWDTQFLRFGVRSNRDSFTVRLDKDVSFDVDLQDSQLIPFFDVLFNELVAEYETALREHSECKRIGFTPPAIHHTSEPNEEAF
jgi:hypothetical protein